MNTNKTREYGYQFDGAYIWGFATVADARAAANVDYNGDWDQDNTGLVARDIYSDGSYDIINACEIGGCDEIIAHVAAQ